MTRRSIVFGAGVSGCAAARLLLRAGEEVRLVSRVETPETAALRAAGASVVLGDPAAAAAAFAAEGGGRAVFSPGIPLGSPEAVACREAGLPIIGELEIGAEYLRARIVAVTGSKGKSSLVKLIADVLNAAGVSAVPCGNYGTALAEVAARDEPPAVAVVECSSFQLETIGERFRPASAVVMNLSADHLDRHGTMARYRDAKLDIFRNLAPGGLALLPAPSEDPHGLNAAFRARHGREATYFGRGADARWRHVDGIVACAGAGIDFDIRGSYFDNAVLGPAAAAACALLTAEGVAPETIAAGVRAFQPLPHRMQLVGEVDGVRFVDDSKATSIAALLAGARMARPPVYLVAGGRLKEKITANGKEVVTSGVEKAYLIGECMEDMALAWAPDLDLEKCGTLDIAVEAAFKEARPGGTILLSPGTASFDQFKDYAQRGKAFAELVLRLQEHTAAAAANPTTPTER
ncbi:MAG: UDP-N-acetylmuramoyl-L-alanine--D-glutamate ligase [Kiritimatiellae bacterium]|nr:UDP-N-acetylmuramoyl-L-alanine--D-glutamate ligase [Kiritimatiellia bacterium]NLE40472.1 UDP-N-acetylmuramoyl-L-alanine--D-glutamate ligase [Lentisphaerota bacterium]